jgi:very-short-patch-repair endonuclease
LRKNPTRAEELLWNKLRKKQLGGLRFRRQHIIHTFIVDFYCPKAELVIEVDGSVHGDQEEYDHERSALLEISGYSVIRFRNMEIEREIDKVLAVIYDTCLQQINGE